MSYEKRFVLSHQTRQGVIDWSRGEWFRHTDAAIAINGDRGVVYRACKAMARDGEAQVRGYGKDLMFRAVVDKTMSVKDMHERATTKRTDRKEHDAHAESGVVRRPGFYSQRGGSWQAKSSGGQGACRHGVRLGSSLS